MRITPAVWASGVLATAALGWATTGCSGSKTGNSVLPAPVASPSPVSGAVADRSGTYFSTLGTQPRHALVLVQTGTDVTWTLSGGGISLAGAGTASGSTVTISTTTPFSFDSTITFSSPTAFEGTWTVTGGLSASSGTITGSTTTWPSYNLPTLGIPRFVTRDYVELAKIDRVSFFRSSAGHDYSDDFEACRSMKQYFLPKAGIDPAAIVITSPVDGKIVGWVQEADGVQLGIESTQHPGIVFALFHVDASITLTVGAAVTAGQVLGTHIGAQTWSDMAVGVALPNGSFQLISYVETLSDAVFSNYQARGLASRADASHSRAARDADPLSCSGETFTGSGALPQFVQLN